MARIKTEKNTTRKDVIVSKAAILFREKGFKAASMRDLAESVGVEAASLYNHIKSKTELLHELCFSVANRFLQKLDEIESEPIPAIQKIEKILPEDNKVALVDETLSYDILIIATGSKIAPEETEGLLGPLWRKDIFDFYTYEGSLALRNKLREWEGGKLVVHLTEMPIKCPVAPLEFAFLADSYFRKKGMRDKVDITYVTPLSGAFTKPTCTKALNYLLEEKQINIEIDFAIERVDNVKKAIIDFMIFL